MDTEGYRYMLCTCSAVGTRVGAIMRMSVHVYAPIGVTRAVGFRSQKPLCVSYFYKRNSKGYEQGDTLI